MNLELVSEEPRALINEEYLEEWIAYREEDLKKPMTPRAIKMLTKKLLQWSPAEQQRIICNAIEMNWRGVYYSEPPRQQSSKDTSIENDLSDRSWAL
jgi:hypothetical protein